MKTSLATVASVSIPKDTLDQVPQAILDFLHCSTPPTWLENACNNLAELLIDHANCEKKAASTALSLMFRYSEEVDICFRMSRLAREELRHYEQVLKIIQNKNISLKLLKPSRYAAALMKEVSKHEPDRLIESLMIGGIIEARSCERFARLIPYLNDIQEFELAKFYSGLLASEARHFEHYLQLAKKYSDNVLSEKEFEDKLNFFLESEAELILSKDPEFHFHSGVPQVSEG